MGVSISYYVERNDELSSEEKKKISKVVQKYKIKNSEQDDWRGDNIQVPIYEIYSAPIVIAGSIEIGNYPEDYEREIEEVVRWCYFLTEVRQELDNSKWTVRLGDEKLIYDEQVGFRLEKLPISLYEDLKPNL